MTDYDAETWNTTQHSNAVNMLKLRYYEILRNAGKQERISRQKYMPCHVPRISLLIKNERWWKVGFLADKMANNSEWIVLFIDYYQPYAWRELLGFLAPRAVEGVEEVRDGKYRRVVFMNTGDEIYNG